MILLPLSDVAGQETASLFWAFQLDILLITVASNLQQNPPLVDHQRASDAESWS